VFVNHGEAGPAAALGESLRGMFPGAEITLPVLEQGFDL